MARRPDLGYFDDGLNLTDPQTYASAIRPFGEASVLPPVAHRSIAFDYLEDEAIWSRAWVAVGTVHDIPAANDILPYTLGYHGIHVQRMSDDSFVGRFNMAQHGGCRMVPDQCQNGTKTRCSFTSCGYSRDRGPIDAVEERATPRLSHQYLGLRPERLLPVQVARNGSLLIVTLNTGATALDPTDLQIWNVPPVAGHWMGVAANWKLVAQSLARCSVLTSQTDTRLNGSRDDGTIGVTWMHPNVVILTSAETQCLVIVQPTAMSKTLMRISMFATSKDSANTVWQSELDAAAELALALQSIEGGLAGVPSHKQTDAVGYWAQRTLIDQIAAMPRVTIDVPMMQPKRSYMR